MGVVKSDNKMEKQDIVNQITCLTGTLDALSRAKAEDAIKEVIAKLRKLVALL
jgi:NAD-dependent DNA ligase